jgi:hypothetical protein
MFMYNHAQPPPPPTHTQPLRFLGFPTTSAGAANDSVNPASLTLDVQGLRQVAGTALAPHIVDREGRRYARTDERLAVGMSGGPVVDGSGRCVGLFQGILPPPQAGRETEKCDWEDEGLEPMLRPLQQKAWELHAAFIPIGLIERFVEERGLFALAASPPPPAAAAAAAGAAK